MENINKYPPLNSAVIEKHNKWIKNNIEKINEITKTAGNNIDYAFVELSLIIPIKLIIGKGSSHIWCSNLKNERLFIIYYQQPKDY